MTSIPVILRRRRRISVGPVAASFTPADLFTSGEAGAWYDIHPDYCFQDAARTTAAAVGDPVGGVTDRSGNANHASISVSAQRPTLRQAAGGQYYLEFDGVNDRLELGSFAIPSTHFQCLGYDTNGDTTGVLWSSDLNTKYGNVFDSGSSTTPISGFGTFAALYVDGVDVTGSVSTRGHVYTQINGKKVSIFQNTSCTGTQAWAFGEYTAVTSFNLSGHLYSMVWRDRLTASERSDLEAYIADKTGVTL